MNPSRLEEILSTFPTRRIAVIGDFFLDKYLDVDPALVEPSLETGLDAHQVSQVRCFAGVAGTVINNLSALGIGQLHVIGAIGDDGEAYELRKCLEATDCQVDRLLSFDELMTPTYLKPRDMTDASLQGEHSRYDTKNRRPTPSQVVEAVVSAMDELLGDIDALIVADQVEEAECGIITSAVRETLATRATQFDSVIFWVDSRRFIREFRNVIIKPNQFETVGRANPSPDERVDLEHLQRELSALRQLTNAPVFVTMGERGMLVSDPAPQRIPTVSVSEPLDTTGAGDSTTAGCVAALTAGASLEEAALIGNLVASITIQQLATTGTAKPEQVVARLTEWHHRIV
ncbi:MAG: carbohydrate kinase [Planctomycetaceae bacterium]|nr:carbohydrate kinase [Planctomycetaceae bacterium]